MDDVKETGRVEAFSDGVFAVAITLLVLNIQAPSDVLADSQLLNILLGRWPNYLAFVTSFATVGIMWINHHRLFNHIKRIDTVLLLLNLNLLMVIVFVPFPTALLAQYISHTDQRLSALFYSGTFVVLAIFFNLLWRYATYKGRLLGKNADLAAVRGISRQYLFGPLLYGVAFGLAWINVPASVVLNLLLAVFFAIPSRKLRELPEA
jgi:TMEM175 potassium channel family protein